ncbi:MAG: hypothetical protein EBX94_02595, partial [Burkholderiaceae bacterium]|nr:hypothetical protein [Burkholderiaceae bacterium]
AAFSFAAAAFFPALVLGIFWKRATKAGACVGMILGLGITVYYMIMTQPWLRGVFNVTSPVELWWGIQPISAGLFGVPLGFAAIIVVRLCARVTKLLYAKWHELDLYSNRLFIACSFGAELGVCECLRRQITGLSLH